MPPDAGRESLRARLFAPKLTGAVLAVAIALAVSFVAILLSGKNAPLGFAYLFEGAVGGWGPIGESAVKGSVLVLTGLSVAIPFTVGLFNIGAEGQLIWGALAAAVAGRAFDLPAPILVPLCLGAAALAGGLWGALPGALKALRGVHEVISTILLNWVAIHLVHGWLVAGPLAAPGSGSAISMAGTAPIHLAAHLFRPFRGSRLDLGLPLSLAIAWGVWFLLTRTWRGFEWRATGAGAEAARASGIRTRRCVVEAMALAGAIAGVAGALLVLGTEHRFPGVFRTGYGFDGIAVALIGGATAPGTALAGLFFGALRAGSTRLQLVGIHPSFADLIQGTAVLLVAMPRAFSPLLVRLRARVVPPTPPP
ncbi:MAG: ABC transporter permease [Myxococcales bacterium]